jgi:hypothetical protein
MGVPLETCLQPERCDGLIETGRQSKSRGTSVRFAGHRPKTGPTRPSFACCGRSLNDRSAQVFAFGHGDPSQGTGIAYSFTADRRGGFDENDIALLQSTLPSLSLAVKAHAGYVIASALLRIYLGAETGRRVHAGAVERGSVEGIHAVLWYADIRGFTLMSDSLPGPVIIPLLNNVFDGLTALYVFHAVRRRVAPRVHAGHERLLSFSTELIRREQPLTASAQSCW